MFGNIRFGPTHPSVERRMKPATVTEAGTEARKAYLHTYVHFYSVLHNGKAHQYGGLQHARHARHGLA